MRLQAWSSCWCWQPVRTGLFAYDALQLPRERLLAFALFAVGSAVLTGLGRAEFDEFGVPNANASRYTIYSSSAIYAILYAATLIPSAGQSSARRMRQIVPAALWLIVVACATLTFTRSWKIYVEVRRFDRLLAIAYAAGENESSYDRLIHPGKDRIPYFKGTLKRLRVVLTATISPPLSRDASSRSGSRIWRSRSAAMPYWRLIDLRFGTWHGGSIAARFLASARRRRARQ